MVKKPYSTPRLVTYGDFKRIVQGNAGKKSDGLPGHTKHCWIAEVLYGPNDPRTALLRAWMSTVYMEKRAGWPLVSVYRRFGERLATVLEHNLALRRGLRVLFDHLVVAALGSAIGRVRGQCPCDFQEPPSTPRLV